MLTEFKQITSNSHTYIGFMYVKEIRIELNQTYMCTLMTHVIKIHPLYGNIITLITILYCDARRRH